MNTHIVLSSLALSHAPGFSFAITEYLVVCFLVNIIAFYNFFCKIFLEMKDDFE